MKKVLLFIISLFTAFAFANVVKAENALVKVYMFEAGGCPACEAQLEYLEGLDSYKEKFEIIRKELYVDHVEWAQGADYELGTKVVEQFNNAGFTEATYTATPLVIVSDIYAANGYNSSLESVIDEAYEKGDKDVVACIENDGENCIIAAEKESKTSDTIIIIAIFVVLIGGMSALVIVGRKKD